MSNVLNKGEYYTTIKNGDYFADVYSHATCKYLYIVELNTYNDSLTTVVEKRRYKKEIDDIFFNPIARDIRNESNIFNEIRRTRISS